METIERCDRSPLEIIQHELLSVVIVKECSRFVVLVILCLSLSSRIIRIKAKTRHEKSRMVVRVRHGQENSIDV